MGKTKTASLRTTRVLAVAALLTALSVVIGIVCKNFLTFQIYYRITFENMPVILAGILFGPWVGGAVGLCADLISCLCSTNPAVNPLISLGAFCVGLMAGLGSRMVPKGSRLRLLLAVGLAHLVGQVCIKSVAKIVWFGMPWWGVFICAGISLVVGTIEFFLLRELLRRPAFTKVIGYEL